MHISPADDREEVDIETANDPVFTAEQIGWRFALGTLILVGAYAAWPLIPVVMMTDLEPGVKAGLSGLLGATPFMSKFVALGDHGPAGLLFSEAQPVHAHSPLGRAASRVIQKRKRKTKAPD